MDFFKMGGKVILIVGIGVGIKVHVELMLNVGIDTDGIEDNFFVNIICIVICYKLIVIE